MKVFQKMEATTIKPFITRTFDKKLNEILKPNDSALTLTALSHFERLYFDLVPSTDLDSGNMIREMFGKLFTFIPTSRSGGDWYFWNGAVHQADPVNRIDDYLAEALANFLQDVGAYAADKYDAKNFSKDDQDAVVGYLKNLRKYARGVRSNGGLYHLKSRITAVFTEAPDYFDHDQQWAVMSNGKVLDLTDIHGDFLEPDPSRPVLRQLGVSLDVDNIGASPLWDASLDAWISKDEQDYLQLAAGAAMLGRGDAKNIVSLVGISNTGKSTYLNVMKEVFGTYAGALPATAIVQKYGGGVNFEQHKARGKRFLYLSEPQKQRTDDAFLKNLAGAGDTIPTAAKGKDSVEWHAQCVLHIASNHTLQIDTRDNAIVERINIVGFDNVFSADTPGRVDRLDKKLVEQEGAQILLWILVGAEKYNELGKIPVPDSIKARAQDNVVESSAPLRWLNSTIVDQRYKIEPFANGSSMVKPKDAYAEFRLWCFEMGEKSTPDQKTWLKEIETFTKRPADKKDQRPGGYARVWGVVPVQAAAPARATTPSFVQDRTSITFGEMVRR